MVMSLIFVVLACAALAAWIWIPKQPEAPNWARLWRWPAIAILALFITAAFYKDLTQAVPTWPVSLVMGLGAWLVIRPHLPGHRGVHLSLAAAAPFGTDFEDWSAMVPQVGDAVDQGRDMVAAGASPWQALIIAAGVPVFAMVWRTLHNIVQPYVERHTARLRLADNNEALEERFRIEDRFGRRGQDDG